jgi:hypothetical protein
MNTVSTSFGDSAIMLRRNFKHTVRNPVTVFNAVLFPIVLMLIFVYVLGGDFKVSGTYIDYATPGLIVMTVCYGLSATATVQGHGRLSRRRADRRRPGGRRIVVSADQRAPGGAGDG